MTPLLVAITLSRGLNPVPFLLGFCFAANAGSAGTIIGSPQNMIAAQGLGISFNGFLKIAAVPALLSLPIVWAIVALLYRGRWQPADGRRRAAAAPPPRPLGDRQGGGRDARRRARLRPHRLAEGARRPRCRGVLLVNRAIASSDMLGKVDGNLLLLLMGLFIVNAAMAATGLPQRLLGDLRVGRHRSRPAADALRW